MQKIIFTKGLPGSGKSTWAKQFVKDNANYIIVNRDDIRKMLAGNILTFYERYDSKIENLVRHIQYDSIHAALIHGYNVIVDGTNFKIDDKFIEKYKEMYFCDVEIKDFTDIHIDLCIERDALRNDNKVGKEIIVKFYEDFLKNKNV